MGGLGAGERQGQLWVPVRDTQSGETRSFWPGCVGVGFIPGSSLGEREQSVSLDAGSSGGTSGVLGDPQSEGEQRLERKP